MSWQLPKADAAPSQCDAGEKFNIRPLRGEPAVRGVCHFRGVNRPPRPDQLPARSLDAELGGC